MYKHPDIGAEEVRKLTGGIQKAQGRIGKCPWFPVLPYPSTHPQSGMNEQTDPSTHSQSDMNEQAGPSTHSQA